MWNIAGVILTERKVSTGLTACVNDTSFTTNSTWTGLGLTLFPLANKIRQIKRKTWEIKKNCSEECRISTLYSRNVTTVRFFAVMQGRRYGNGDPFIPDTQTANKGCQSRQTALRYGTLMQCGPTSDQTSVFQYHGQAYYR
jgi:hypothetical protein